MARKKPAAGKQPREVPMPLDELDQMTGRRAPDTRSDPAMRDGDSSRGTPYELDVGMEMTDNDVGDEAEGTAYSGPAGGAVGGTPAEGRASGGKKHGGISSSGSSRGDSTIGSR
jgi:hypothetical protein